MYQHSMIIWMNIHQPSCGGIDNGTSIIIIRSHLYRHQYEVIIITDMLFIIEDFMSIIGNLMYVIFTTSAVAKNILMTILDRVLHTVSSHHDLHDHDQSIKIVSSWQYMHFGFSFS